MSGVVPRDAISTSLHLFGRHFINAKAPVVLTPEHVAVAPLLMPPVGIMNNAGTRPLYKIKYAHGFPPQLPCLN